MGWADPPPARVPKCESGGKLLVCVTPEMKLVKISCFRENNPRERFELPADLSFAAEFGEVASIPLFANRKRVHTE